MRRTIWDQQTGAQDVMIRTLTFSDLELPVDKSPKVTCDQADQGDFSLGTERHVENGRSNVSRQPLEIQPRGKLRGIMRK